MEVPMGEGRKLLNDPWNIQGFGEMDIRRKNAGKKRPSRDAGIAPQKEEGGSLVGTPCSRKARSQTGSNGKPPGHPSCSLSPHDETVVAQCAQ